MMACLFKSLAFCSTCSMEAKLQLPLPVALPRVANYELHHLGLFNSSGINYHCGQSPTGRTCTFWKLISTKPDRKVIPKELIRA